MPCTSATATAAATPVVEASSARWVETLAGVIGGEPRNGVCGSDWDGEAGAATTTPGPGAARCTVTALDSMANGSSVRTRCRRPADDAREFGVLLTAPSEHTTESRT